MTEIYIAEDSSNVDLKYKTEEEAIKDHVENYRTDGITKGKGAKLSPDFYRVDFVVQKTPAGSNVLDVGCNGGTIGVPLLSKGCFVSGIDVVKELVDKAKKRGIFAEVGKAEDLSNYKDEEFEVVICAEVLEHLYDPMPAVKEAYRVLKPGGTYIITVPAPTGVMAEGKLGDYHQQNFTAETLDTLLYSVFPKDKAFFWGIPYSKEFCIANTKTKEEFDKLYATSQWLGIVAEKPR